MGEFVVLLPGAGTAEPTRFLAGVRARPLWTMLPDGTHLRVRLAARGAGRAEADTLASALAAADARLCRDKQACAP